mgnify:CR=1 FL=1
MNMAFLGCAILLIGLLVLFICYNDINKTQMQELMRAQREAENANKAKSDFLSSPGLGAHYRSKRFLCLYRE